MDLTAEVRVIAPTVKKTAPPIRIAGALVDLLEIPSGSIKSPRTKRATDKTISKAVDILLMVQPPAYGLIGTRHRLGAVQPRP
jgi:hypothetical protein